MKRTILSGILFILCIAFAFNSETNAQNIDIQGPMGSGQFGTRVYALPSGNIVITDPLYDIPNGAQDVGAVYLYNGSTGALISTLTGSTTNNQVGSSGVTVLTNGNYVIQSPFWDNGGTTDVGAATFGNGTTGVSGTVSAANSLIGSSANDNVSTGGITALTNGNYVVISRNWDNGGTINVGAVTFGNGTTGITGVVSAANSLIGSSANDQIGNSGVVGKNGVTALTNGNYVVRSLDWDNGGTINVGAATFGNGTTGVTGAVSVANSLIGSTANDNVGLDITALTNGNYVVRSPFWNNGGTADVGAVTFGNGTNGLIGTVSAVNSLVGSTAFDNIGDVTALTNGNYVVSSSNWNNGGTADVGAATFVNGTTGLTGAVSAANSLIGSTANNNVGNRVTALTNGNYVVSSRDWDNSGTANVGAATFGNGTTGITGTVSAANSLIGSSESDNVGNTVIALTNGNYVVISIFWNNVGTQDAGAVTFGNGTTGVIGTVSVANSLIGSTTSDRVGGVTALTNGNYVISCSGWDNGGIINVGAVTFGDGTNGVTGTISAANSLIGSTANERVGIGGITALTNGNFVVSSPIWDNGGTADAGAVTFGDGTTGITGEITAANSLVGSTTEDQISFNGITGIGEITTRIDALPNGNYAFGSPNFDNNGTVDAGAVTVGNGNGGTVGTLTSSNSFLGTVANGRVGDVYTFDSVNNQLVIGRPVENIVTLFRPFGPTAANVSVSGRVLAAGRGIPRAFVMMTDSNGLQRTARTNMFGYYRFDQVQAGDTYVFNILSKQYSFASQVINVSDDLTNLNFTAQQFDNRKLKE